MNLIHKRIDKQHSRQSNIELLRIVATIMVLALHVNFLSIGSPTRQELTEFPISSFLRIEFETIAIVAVNLFILISGYFGIKLKTQSVCKFLFQVLFWSIIPYIILTALGDSSLSVKILYNLCIPGYGNWFVESYLALLLLSPLANAFTEKSTKIQLRNFIIIFLAVQSVFGWMQPSWTTFSCGYSVTSFIGLYLIGRYLRQYPQPKPIFHRKTSYLTCSVTISTIISLLAFITIVNVSVESISDRIYPLIMAYSSPFNIACAILIFSVFTKLSIRSRFINWVAASSFSIFLIHTSYSIFPHFISTANYLFYNYGMIKYALLISVFIIAVFSLCILLDQIRIIAWNVCLSIYKNISITLRLK